MLPIDNRISRAQRLLEIIEEDAPFLARRVAELTPERQKQAKGYVAEIAAQTRAEIARLLDQRFASEPDDTTPQPAD